MKIDIKATKIELTEEIKDYVQKKMDMVDKYLGKMPVINCRVEVGTTVGGQNKGKIYRTEVNLDLAGTLIRVEKTADELYKSVDKVKDHLDLQIKKHKERMIERKRKAA